MHDIGEKAVPIYSKRTRELRPKASKQPSSRRWRCELCARTWRSEVKRGDCPMTPGCKGRNGELPA